MANMKPKMITDVKVRTGKVRASYAHFFEPYSMEEDQKKKYQVSAIIPKSDKETVRMIESAIKQAFDEGKERYGKDFKGPKLSNPLRDGDTDRPDDPAYADSYFINCKNDRKPGLFDENGHKTDDPDVLYSGCYGSVIVEFYPFSKPANKGVAASLVGFMKLEDGEPLGGSNGNVAADFDIEDTGDDDDFLS